MKPPQTDPIVTHKRPSDGASPPRKPLFVLGVSRLGVSTHLATRAPGEPRRLATAEEIADVRAANAAFDADRAAKKGA